MKLQSGEGWQPVSGFGTVRLKRPGKMPNLWYAMQSKPNLEDGLYTELVARDVEVFYPHIRVTPVNPRARKIKAYFPGYLFVHVDIEKVGISMVQYMPFARGIITFDRAPAVVPDGLISAIRRRVEEATTPAVRFGGIWKKFRESIFTTGRLPDMKGF
jgi:transcription antitermination factor NusG